MKRRLPALILVLILTISAFNGCSIHAPVADIPISMDFQVTAPTRADIPDAQRDINEESARIYVYQPEAAEATVPAEVAPFTPVSNGQLTKRDAEATALTHAGLDPNHISFLYTKYDTDDGVPQYEVNFRMDDFEYEINVHAETGEILEFEEDYIYSES